MNDDDDDADYDADDDDDDDYDGVCCFLVNVFSALSQGG